jgi:hypothetical protein
MNMTNEELTDVCFRRALVDVGYAEALRLKQSYGENLCAWLAHPRPLKPRSGAGYVPLAYLHRNPEPVGDALLNTELQSRHSSIPDSHPVNSEGEEMKVRIPQPAKGICALSAYLALCDPEKKISNVQGNRPARFFAQVRLTAGLGHMWSKALISSTRLRPTRR